MARQISLLRRFLPESMVDKSLRKSDATAGLKTGCEHAFHAKLKRVTVRRGSFPPDPRPLRRSRAAHQEHDLAICETALGPDHPSVAVSLSNQAEPYRAQGRYTHAEPLYRRALAIYEKAVGPNHPDGTWLAADRDRWKRFQRA